VRKILISLLAISICLLFFFIIIFWHRKDNTINQSFNASINNIDKKNINKKQFVVSQDYKNNNSNDHDNLNTKIIMPSTIMSYNYHSIDTGRTQTTSELAPYFMIGMDESQLKDYFKDWSIKEFNNKNIVMQKDVDENEINNGYLIGVKDGYVAIFYLNENNFDDLTNLTLKEMTLTPIDSLTIEDRERIYHGVKIFGDETLSKIIQDYES
jgi:hypothetical protein